VAVRRQLQVGLGVAPEIHDQPEFFAQLRGRIRVGDEILDAFAVGENLVLAANGLLVIADGLATG
jgi:hypothetical protein